MASAAGAGASAAALPGRTITATTELRAASRALHAEDSSGSGIAQHSHVTTGMTQKQRKAYALKQRADEARIQQLRGIFAAYDEDRDGLLNEVELASAMLALGLEPLPKQMQRFQLLSPHQHGVDLPTFVKVCMSRASAMPGAAPVEPGETSLPSLAGLFERFDEGKTGKIPLALLLHLLAEVAAPTALSMAEVQDLLRMSGILTPAVASDPRLLYSLEVDTAAFARLMAFVPLPLAAAATGPAGAGARAGGSSATGSSSNRQGQQQGQYRR